MNVCGIEYNGEKAMIQVIIQSLIRNRSKSAAELPLPTINDVPQPKDRSGQILAIFALLIIIALIFM